MFLNAFLIITGAYMIGAIPTAFLAGKLVKGIDIRQYGSQNVGATNVFRTVGKLTGVIVLIIDILKGIIPVLLAGYLLPQKNLELLKILSGLAAICGHNWTIFLKFKGGKGVATSTGVMLILAPQATLSALGIFMLAVFITRYISVGSILAAVAMPYLVLLFSPGKRELLLFVTILTILIIIKHQANISRLLNNQEHKFRFTKRGQ